MRSTRRALHPYVSDLAAAVLADGAEPRSVEIEGTLAFFDVSGFTPMTERLATLGRAGAEHINDVLNRTFTRLIDLVSREGGDVLEFGGDAAVVLFTGAEHAVRGASAAASVVRWMRRHPRIATPAGRVELGVSCGMASGTQHYHLCGVTRRALVVAGPVSTAMARMEAGASRGEVQLDASTASELPAAWRRADADRCLLDVDAAQSPGRTSYRRSTNGEAPCAPDILLPVQFRALTDVGRRVGELKQVAVGFLRLTGTDELAAARGVPALAARLREVSAAVDEVTSELGVCWLETQAEADSARWTIVSGATDSREDDGELVLLAMRRIVDRVPELRGGANFGVVFVGDMGHPDRCTYIVMGDTTNVAARLMGLAQPGQIVAGERLAEVAHHAVELTPMEPVRVKGKRDPIRAALVGRTLAAAAPPHTTAGGESAHVVGRDRELEQLRAAVVHGATVELVGEAGVGKSTLWGAVRAGDAGRTWFVERARPHEATSPYLPVRRLTLALLARDGAEPGDPQALRAAILGAAPAVEPWLALVAEALGIEAHDGWSPTPEVEALSVEFRPARTQTALAEVLAGVAADVTVVLEDVHWFDQASSGTVEAWLRDPDRPASPVILTRRPGGWAPPVGSTIALEPLSDADAERLLVETLPASLASDATIERLARSGSGNPLFLLELARAVAAGSNEIPATVERVLAARIDRLPVDARRLVRDLSVLGASADRRLAARVLDAADLAAPGPRDAALAGLVGTDEHRLWFEHDLVRTAAYEGQSVARRRHLHRRAGEVIEGWGGDVPVDDVVGELAYHAVGSGIASRIVAWNGRAAAAAMESGASETAARLWSDVVRAQPRAKATRDERRATLRLLAEAHERAGAPDEALLALRRATRLTDDGDERGRIAVDRARLMEKTGRYVSAQRVARAALPGCSDDTVRARLVLAPATVDNFLGRWQRCLREVEALLDDERLAADPRVAAQAHLLAEWCCAALRRPERADHERVAMRLLTDLDDSIGIANLALNLGISAWQEGRVDDAVRHFALSSERYQRAGDVVGGVLADNNLAEIRTLQVRLDEAARLLEHSARVLRAAGYPTGLALSLSGLARVAAWRGDHERALVLQHEAAQSLASLGNDDYVADALARLAEIHLLRGDAAAAMSLLDRADAEARRLEAPVTPATIARLRTWALVQDGELADATSSARLAIELADRDGADYEGALARIALGRLTDDADLGARGVATLCALGVVAPPPGTVLPSGVTWPDASSRRARAAS